MVSKASIQKAFTSMGGSKLRKKEIIKKVESIKQIINARIVFLKEIELVVDEKQRAVYGNKRKELQRLARDIKDLGL